MKQNWVLTRRNDPRDVQLLGAVDLFKPSCHGCGYHCTQRVVTTIRTEMPGIGYSELHLCAEHADIVTHNENVQYRRDRRRRKQAA